MATPVPPSAPQKNVHHLLGHYQLHGLDAGPVQSGGKRIRCVNVTPTDDLTGFDGMPQRRFIEKSNRDCVFMLCDLNRLTPNIEPTKGLLDYRSSLRERAW